MGKKVINLTKCSHSSTGREQLDIKIRRPCYIHLFSGIAPCNAFPFMHINVDNLREEGGQGDKSCNDEQLDTLEDHNQAKEIPFIVPRG